MDAWDLEDNEKQESAPLFPAREEHRQFVAVHDLCGWATSLVGGVYWI